MKARRKKGRPKPKRKPQVKPTHVVLPEEDFELLDRGDCIGLEYLRASRVRAKRSRTTADQPLPSLAEIRRQQAAEVAAKQNEALDYFRRGQRAQADGKPTVAGVYYKMAARRATGTLAKQVRAAEQSLRTPTVAGR